MRAVELGESPAYIQGLRHDPTPRKSLATWPTIKAYHTLKARKMVTHLRTRSCSADRGCRQKYQQAGSRPMPIVTTCSLNSKDPRVHQWRSSSMGILTY